MPLTIAAVGDIMLGSDYPRDRLPANADNLLAPVTPWLKTADITFGNLEGVLMDGGEPIKQCNNPAVCFLFRSPARFATTLARAGFDVMSLANNHAHDFGETGRSASMAALDAAGILHSGRAGDVASWQVRGRRIALIAFAPNIGAHSLLDITGARQKVAALAATHDIVIVSFHGGAEGTEYLHVAPGMETFVGEQRGDLIAFSHAVIEAGADLVLGHGPHVPRALEVYRGRLIAYSLGNFATWFGINVQGVNGYAPVLHVVLAPDGALLHGHIHSAIQSFRHAPEPDPANQAALLVRELTQEDFAGGGLLFDANGGFVPAANTTD